MTTGLLRMLYLTNMNIEVWASYVLGILGREDTLNADHREGPISSRIWPTP